jgi:hypothetical protein
MIGETDGLYSRPTQCIEWLFIALSFDPQNSIGMRHRLFSVDLHVGCHKDEAVYLE